MATKSTARTAMVRVTQIRSTIGFNRSQAEVVRGLGLRRIGHSVDLQDIPSIRGMLHKVRHLVTVDDAGTPTAAKD
jgi:large subunit ribosomal protein L30